MGVPPSLPHRGDAAQGDNPLDPISTFLPYLKRISLNLQRAVAFFMEAPAGAEAKVAAAQKSVRAIFP